VTPRAPALSSALAPALAVVLAAWAGAVLLVGPSGNFPLSDDWAYAHVVRSLVEGRGFDFLPWTGASLVLQALYGAAISAVAGFSHDTLRATTLVVSALGIAAFHGLLREVGASAAAAAAGAALLAFSPLWFNLSFTFMTDVPFAAAAITAAAMYARALDRRSRRGLAVAGAMAAAAFLVRQHAVWIALAAALAALAPSVEPGALSPSSRPRREALADAAAALAIPALVAVVYAWWATASGQAPLAVHNKLGEAATTPWMAVAGAGFRALATLGFLGLPWALACGLEGRLVRRTFAVAFALLAGAAALLYAREGATMFYLTNVLGDFSLGAVTTRDVLFLDLPHGPSAGAAFRFLLTLASLASAAALVAHLVVGTLRGAGLSRASLFVLLAFALSAAGTLLQARYYFDRYLVVLLPLAVAAATALGPTPRLRAGAVTAWLALALYAVAGTHDYLAWNRARWDLLASAEAGGADARQIDGGFEYNAWRLAASTRRAPTDAEARRGQAASVRSWWWVEDDEWIVAFRGLDGYVAADSRTFPRWLPPGTDRVLLLRRSEERPRAAGEP
jgi:hypothetical protein